MYACRCNIYMHVGGTRDKDEAREAGSTITPGHNHQHATHPDEVLTHKNLFWDRTCFGIKAAVGRRAATRSKRGHGRGVA